MATFFVDASLDQMLDAFTATTMSLHSGDPGVDGLSNDETTGAHVACSFSASEDGDVTGRKRVLAAQVDFTGLTPSVSVTHFGLWVGATYKGCIERTSGDAAANTSGEYSVTVGTQIALDVA